MTLRDSARPPAWKWSVCAVLLLATMLNYMDRQTLSQTAKRISLELGTSNEQYGTLEFVFGIAFALGGIVTGALVDSIPVRWMYPAVVLGWSLAGFATAYSFRVGAWLAELWHALSGSAISFPGLSREPAQAYLGLLVCRAALGFFEAGQWPCALVTTQRLLDRQERTFGNSLLQSGASLGAILTPLVVQRLVTDEPGSWCGPFAVIGAIGALWIVPWLVLIGPRDLARPESRGLQEPQPDGSSAGLFVRRALVLVSIVVTINLTWHYFRAWLPKYLGEFAGYEEATVNYFTSAYYIATDAGCLAVGFATRWLARRGWDAHRARLATFGGCALLTALSIVAARLPHGPWLLAVLLIIGFGSLGLFPIYYSLSQELSARDQGKITGILGAVTWLSTAVMHKWAGAVIDRTHSHAPIMTAVGLLPLIGFAALVLFWGGGGGRQSRMSE